ncbi:hypothetical protein CU097_003583 [Rhizopus azygosporus]|uniref:Restriction of telomere capping protein 4 n=1 Tax=Rhizopus azygosporus TaxID=86630 RepID=A0A367IW30_RHIAZ|nr:hypothetical protein CU097_003583 [Rhizopus azygosporus]
MKPTEGRVCKKRVAADVDLSKFSDIFGIGPSNRTPSTTTSVSRDYLVFECPFCYETLIPPYPEELEKAVKAIKDKKIAYEQDQRKMYEERICQEKAEGRVFIEPFMMHDDGLLEEDKKMICKTHKRELELKPRAREKGYPETIDFDKLASRIIAFKDDLLVIIDGKAESDFALEAKRVIDQVGANKARDTTEMMNQFEATLPGYYGMKGAEKMMETLCQLFLDKELTKQKCWPLKPIEYIQQVLVPECGVRLIQQDMGVESDKAKEIMKESVEYSLY